MYNYSLNDFKIDIDTYRYMYIEIYFELKNLHFLI